MRNATKKGKPSTLRLVNDEFSYIGKPIIESQIMHYNEAVFSDRMQNFKNSLNHVPIKI